MSSVSSVSFRGSSENLRGAPTDQRRKLLCQLQETRSQLGAFAFVFMLEEEEGVAPRLLLELLRPVAEVAVVVLGAAQAEIAPIGRGDERDFQLIVRFGDAQ